MNPSMMPRKAAPVRTVSRAVDRIPNCDWDDRYGKGKPCGCEGFRHTGVESVRKLHPLSKPNRSMADAIRKAGLR